MNIEDRYRKPEYRARLSASIKKFYASDAGMNARKKISARQCINTAEKFWDLVDMRDGDACWQFKGNTQSTNNGYGQISVRGLGIRDTMAHRIAWTLTIGPIPPGMCVLHSCDNPPCCNPDHLFLGTARDNMIDMSLKGRDAISRGSRQPLKGEQSPTSKLTESEVGEIRRRRKDGERGTALAREFNVHFNTIYSICNLKIWSHVK